MPASVADCMLPRGTAGLDGIVGGSFTPQTWRGLQIADCMPAPSKAVVRCVVNPARISSVRLICFSVSLSLSLSLALSRVLSPSPNQLPPGMLICLRLFNPPPFHPLRNAVPPRARAIRFGFISTVPTLTLRPWHSKGCRLSNRVRQCGCCAECCMLRVA